MGNNDLLLKGPHSPTCRIQKRSSASSQTTQGEESFADPKVPAGRACLNAPRGRGHVGPFLHLPSNLLVPVGVPAPTSVLQPCQNKNGNTA